MAWEHPILDLPAGLAGSTFATGNGYNSTGQYLFVKCNGTNNTYVPCSANTDRPIGVAQNNPAAAGALAVRAIGITKLVAGGTLTAGDRVGSDAQGKAVKKNIGTTAADLGQYEAGEVLEGCAAGELAVVLLIPANRIAGV